MTAFVTQQHQQLCSMAEDFQPKQAAATNGTSRNRQLTTQSVLTSVASFPTRSSSCAFGTSGTFGICHHVCPDLVRVTEEEQPSFLLMCFCSEASCQMDSDLDLICHQMRPNLVRVTEEEQKSFLLMYCFSLEAAWQMDNDWDLLTICQHVRPDLVIVTEEEPLDPRGISKLDIVLLRTDTLYRNIPHTFSADQVFAIDFQLLMFSPQFLAMLWRR